MYPYRLYNIKCCATLAFLEHALINKERWFKKKLDHTDVVLVFRIGFLSSSLNPPQFAFKIIYSELQSQKTS